VPKTRWRVGGGGSLPGGRFRGVRGGLRNVKHSAPGSRNAGRGGRLCLHRKIPRSGSARR
jgi:hypothetical protein